MFDIILYQPEIPPNTGNIMRLCANTGARLHLVRPLGFQLNDRTLTRAGMDYREFANVIVHRDWQACQEALGSRHLYAVSTRGQTRYDLPAVCRRRRLPVRAGNARTACRGIQHGAPGAAHTHTDAGRKPQHQSGECGSGRAVRGVATARFPG